MKAMSSSQSLLISYPSPFLRLQEKWEQILLLDLSKDLESQWPMEVLILDTWPAKTLTRERCLEESLEFLKIFMVTLHSECLCKPENNILEEKMLQATFVLPKHC